MKRRTFASLASASSILALSRAAFTAPGPTASAADEKAILEAIGRWDQGWKVFDAELASRDYGPDAEWTNAFGHPEKGKAQIFKFLASIYQTPAIRARTSTPSKTTIRFVKPDVASASSYRETVGQKTASGGQYPTRKTHDLRVLVREQGKWIIVSHLIMDEKETRP